MGANRMSERRELYRSPNGDSWFLGREPTNGHAFIIHQPNAPSGGRLSHLELGVFLRDAAGPEQRALLRLIGTLVEIPHTPTGPKSIRRSAARVGIAPLLRPLMSGNKAARHAFVRLAR